MDAQLFGKNNDVVALSQPIHRHLAECPRVSPHSSLCHCSSFQLRSVPLESVSKLGFSPNLIGPLITLGLVLSLGSLLPAQSIAPRDSGNVSALKSASICA